MLSNSSRRESDVFEVRLENLLANNSYCARISYIIITILLLKGKILTLLTTLKVLFLQGNKIGSFVLHIILNFVIKLVACGLDKERNSFMLIFFNS